MPVSRAPTHPKLPSTATAGALRRGEAWGYLALAALIAAAWQLSRQGWYTAHSDTGYWIGVIGGVCMLLLFLYPLRKRWPALARVGKAKHWFVVHMVLGIVGPVTVLAHSTFRVGSLNAGVALYSMLIVAASGIVGRFIYMRIHRGLGGERQTHAALREALGLAAPVAHSQLAFAPATEQALRDIDHHAGTPGDALREQAYRLLVLPWHLKRVRQRCRHDVAERLAERAAAEGWTAAQQQSRRRHAQRLVADYVASVQRVAQCSAYSRLFSLWHVLHVPFVFTMVLCAVFHIVAVHAY